MAFTQEERICQVTSPLGESALLLASMTARESTEIDGSESDSSAAETLPRRKRTPASSLESSSPV